MLSSNLRRIHAWFRAFGMLKMPYEHGHPAIARNVLCMMPIDTSASLNS